MLYEKGIGFEHGIDEVFAVTFSTVEETMCAVVVNVEFGIDSLLLEFLVERFGSLYRNEIVLTSEEYDRGWVVFGDVVCGRNRREPLRYPAVAVSLGAVVVDRVEQGEEVRL